MRALLDVVLFVLDIYVYIVLAMAILSWLAAFSIISFSNDTVRNIWRFLLAATEPALRPIRNILPNLGGVDISPLILLLGIMFVKSVIIRYVYPNVF